MKKNKLIIIGLSIVLIAILAIFIFQSQAEKKPIKIEWTMETIQVENGWGFTLLMNGKVNIKQDRIPAIPGKTPFSSEESARQIGEIMLKRIKNNERPSISKSELIEFGVIDSLYRPIPLK
jgi:predicted Holliday junction resolvase-like endonuclease